MQNKKNAFIGVIVGCSAVAAVFLMMNGCSRVEPNYEGVLMENYGRNGKADFSTVSGRQWTFFPGVELYQVPMFETSGDPQAVQVSAKDAGVFTVDPSYQYQPIRGKGVDIVFNYKHLGINQPEVMMDNVENSILNKLVTNAYREEARNYTTDSLMNNLNTFERQVETRLKKDFENKLTTYQEELNNAKEEVVKPFQQAQILKEKKERLSELNRILNSDLQTKKEENLDESKEVLKSTKTYNCLTGEPINIENHSSGENRWIGKKDVERFEIQKKSNVKEEIGKVAVIMTEKEMNDYKKSRGVETEEITSPSNEKKLYIIPVPYYNISDLKITKEIEQKFVPMKEKEQKVEKNIDKGIER